MLFFQSALLPSIFLTLSFDFKQKFDKFLFLNVLYCSNGLCVIYYAIEILIFQFYEFWA